MAYKAKYTLKRSVSSGTDEDARAIVKVKFRFGDEVVPQEREAIRSRFRTIGYNGQDKLLVRYFQGIGYKYFCGIPQVTDDRAILKPSESAAEAGIERVRIKSHILRTGFDITVKANKPLPLEEMLNLEEINNLILTGKMPEKPGEK